MNLSSEAYHPVIETSILMLCPSPIPCVYFCRIVQRDLRYPVSQVIGVTDGQKYPDLDA